MEGELVEKIAAQPDSVKRRFPTLRQSRAVEIGADELMSLVEWTFRSRPRALRNIRRIYRGFCLFLLGRIEYSIRPGRQNRARAA